MSAVILLLARNRRLFDSHISKKENATLSIFWQLMPFFIVKFVAKRRCKKKRINNTMYVEAFPQTFISIGKIE